MTNKESSDKNGYVESIKIIDIEKRYKPGPKHYVYVIQVTWINPSNQFMIYRRYAQFFDLQCKLLDLFAETPIQSANTNQSRQIPFLPGKIILGRSQIRQIALERQQALDQYCQTLISLPEYISRSRPILEFFHPSSADIQQSAQSVVISEPSTLATYRCLADFTATDKLEISLKRNNLVQVLQKHSNGWWFVQYNDQTGFVPGSYLQPSELERGAREKKTLENTSNETFIVNTQYESKGEDELSLEQGSFVIVIERSLTGWWTVKFNDKIGRFPALYLSSCQGRHIPGTLPNNSPTDTTKTLQLNDSDDSDWDDDVELYACLSNHTDLDLYYAHTNFTDTTGECLSFQRGDLIEIHEKHPSGWWFGRRRNKDTDLTWIPANFLQKEPILLDEIKINDSERPNVSLQFPIDEEQQQRVKDKIPIVVIHKINDNKTEEDVIYSTVIKKPKSIETKNIPVKSHTISSTSSHVNNNQASTPKTVKDLVKLFNGL
ncbi:hypothetical protein I4U23_009234 [Adineta vaga]|nr:hypothetical protein I4U23_009234 [Adineta vaga]